MRFPPWLVGLVVALLLGALWWSLAWDGGVGRTAPGAEPGPTGTDTRPWDGIDACEDDVLPATTVPVVEDIWTGGPYDYPDRDGTRFGNYEGYLPDEDLGYYREYTVRTPGLDHRGPRRIVTGGGAEDEPEVWYYTEDHYESFCEFAP
ncbi:ribonuclease domain-containing protein [Ornithinimicrobium sufpigmenti]|uniref:ribonuclease domain-containing protein n=1 Tax=Ornithinimicrobium sufpigmenti TaxID=2508882 RepID=UPI001035B8FC|nr:MULTISPECIES: ribonuclease domain-containing protein [unclassified Ornithinimicrobium]